MGELEKLDRDAYLAQVGTVLPFDPPERQEILAELSAHLDDAVEALRARGLGTDEADRTALGRLGPPGTLARELTRARRTPRRVLSAAGAGSWAALTTIVTASVYGLLLVVLLALTLVALDAARLALARTAPAIGRAFGTSTSGLDNADGAALTLLILVPVAYALGLRLPRVVAARGAIAMAAARRLIGPVGTAAWLGLALFVRSGPLDWAGVVVLLSLPAWFVIGASRPASSSFPPRNWPRLRLALVLIVATVVLSLGAAETAQPHLGQTPGPVDPLPDFGRIGALLPAAVEAGVFERQDAWPIDSGGTWDGAPLGSIGIVVADRTVLAGWRDLRVEGWAGSEAGPDLSATAPFTAVPAQVVALDPSMGPTWPDGRPAPDAMGIGGAVRIDRVPGISWAWVALTGTGANGTRYRLAGPDPYPTAFQGTVWDWFAAIFASR